MIYNDKLFIYVCCVDYNVHFNFNKKLRNITRNEAKIEIEIKSYTA